MHFIKLKNGWLFKFTIKQRIFFILNNIYLASEMKKIYISFFLVLITLCFSFKNLSIKDIQSKLSEEEYKLYQLIMSYRQSKGLPKIPLSKSLTYVAQLHCKDLVLNKPDLGQGCNAHSWSDKGRWSSCCYTPDHAKANCMWDKPRELTNYEGDGFEIAVGSSAEEFKNFEVTPEFAIESWKKSKNHNNVIVNLDVWKDVKWNAIGIGIYKGFATVWFGKITDKDGVPERIKK